MAFFIEARPQFEGKVVEVQFYEGTVKDQTTALGGALTLNRMQWEALRILLVAGIRNSRVPTQLHDGTRPPGTGDQPNDSLSRR